MEYKIDSEPTTHTMNDREPFNDLSWNDDPLHSPNRTEYIEKLRARVKELEGDNAHMVQVVERVSEHGHEDDDYTDCSLCAAVKTVLDRAHPGQTLLDKLTALEKERDQLKGEVERAKTIIQACLNTGGLRTDSTRQLFEDASAFVNPTPHDAK